MSSTSDSSGGHSLASGRSSIDDSNQQQGASHAFSPFGAAFPPRRSSTPATAFLQPRFWQSSAQPQQHEAPGSGQAGQAGAGAHVNLQHSHSHTGGEAHSVNHNAFITLPRRTSFGTVLGNNRLGALSALGIGPHSPYMGAGSRAPNAAANGDSDAAGSLRKQPSHGRLTPMESAVSSAESTPAPSMPSSPVQRPQKTRTVYLPGPDGICVESRSRPRSDARAG